jgi:hypothetical protein
MPAPISFEWRIESRAPNGYTKFLPFGDDRNYLTTQDKYLEAITSLKVNGWGDCLEASFQAVKSYLPNDHLSSANVIGASIRYANTGNWSDVYAGVVTSPGSPNSYELSTISLLGLRRRLYETVVPPRFGVVTDINTDPWTVNANQDGRTGDVGQVIRNLIASVIAQLGGNGATLSKVLTGVPAVTGYTVTVDPNFNSAGELIDKILELIPTMNEQKAIWGVNGKREVFAVMPGGVIGLTVIDGRKPGTTVDWNAVDSSKIISAVRWVGFSIERDAWSTTPFIAGGGYPKIIPSAERQNFVSHESQGDQSYGYAAIRENIPENLITGIPAEMDASPRAYDFGTSTWNPVGLPWVKNVASPNEYLVCKSNIYGFPVKASRVDGVRVEANFSGGASALLAVYRRTGDGFSAGSLTWLSVVEGDKDYWFSSHQTSDNLEQVFVQIVAYIPAGGVATVKQMYLLQLDTPLLDRIAQSRYRFPSPDAATVTVEGVILEPKPLVEITFQAIDGTVKTVTRSAETYEYSISANGYPTTIIRASQARDANESAIWSEIKGRDKRSTSNALAYAARGR